MKTKTSLALALSFACGIALVAAAHSLHHYCMSKADIANSPAMIAAAKWQNALLNAVGM